MNSDIPFDQIPIHDIIGYLREVPDAGPDGEPSITSMDTRIIKKVIQHIDRANDLIAGLVAHSCTDGKELNSWCSRDLANALQWLAAEEVVSIKVDGGRGIVAEWS